MRNTPNYNLPQFDGTDKFDKDVLNDAYLKLDEAINDLQETFNLGAGDAGLLSKEVVEARKGKAKLVDKITELEESDKDLDTEINVLKIADTTNKKELQTQIDTWNNFKANGGEIGGDIKVPSLSTFKNDMAFRIREANGVDNKISMFLEAKETGERMLYVAQNNVDLGVSSRPWKNLYLSGVATDQSGYTKLPNGMILQWGIFVGTGFINFRTTFPTACLNVSVTPQVNIGGSPVYLAKSCMGSFNTTGFNAVTYGYEDLGVKGTPLNQLSYKSTIGASGFQALSYYIAIGY